MRPLDERYQLGRPIGRGGVGEVYEGWQVALERKVAVKLLRPELTRSPAAVRRFVREARTTCRLNHQNVVTVFDVGETPEGQRFLVMELLEGRTLAEHLEEHGALPLADVALIARQIVGGMAAGQGVGLVHRDLKPENIFLLPGQHVKILDFGLATLLEPDTQRPSLTPTTSLTPTGQPSNPTFPADEAAPLPDHQSEASSAPSTADHASLGRQSMPTESVLRPPKETADQPTQNQVAAHGGLVPNASTSRLTRPGALMGTPRYMAPEQALRWRVDHRSDLYSFGCILFEMISGESPMVGPSGRDFMHQHVHADPRDLRALSPHTPNSWARITARLLEKSPDDRFADWTELAEGLRRLEGARPARAVEAAATTLPLTRPTEPYRFLQPFNAATRHLFFGRDLDVDRFRTTWNHADRPPILVLSGASGVGKTSFLLARVLPHLEETGHKILRVRGGAEPFATLERLVHRSLARDTDGEHPDTMAPLPQLMDTLADRSGNPLAVVFDQLEELFTLGDSESHAAFQASLASLIAGGEAQARVILSIREDYLGALIRALHPLPVGEWSRTLALRPLEPEDMAAALEGPTSPGAHADYAPFSFEDGLVEEIVADLLEDSAGEVAPRIQAVGSRLWEMARQEQSTVITRAQYTEGLGGARGILARILDEAITDLDHADQGVAKELLRALSHLPGSATSRPAPESELMVNTRDLERRSGVLRRLEDRWRIVQGYTDPRWPEERAYRIAHEALIARIQQYGEEGTERNRARQLFLHGFNLWLQGGRKDKDLLPEAHFEDVQQQIEDLVLRSADERRFFDDSRRRHNEGWERRYKEARNARYRKRMLLTLYPASLLALGVLVGQAPVDFSTLKRTYAWVMSRLQVSGVDFAGMDLQGLDLKETFLRGADLQDADLRDADLSGADLQQAALARARLDHARLDDAVLRAANLLDADLSAASLVRSDLRGADLRSHLEGADLSLARFDVSTRWPAAGPSFGALGPGGRAAKLDASGADLDGLDLFQLQAPGIILTRARLGSAQISESDLQGADLAGAVLVNAKLARADLRGTILDSARLEGTDLRQADLAGASLRAALLSGANLSGATLDGADLCGADLGKARVQGATWVDATACPDTLWPQEHPPHGVRVVVDVSLETEP